MKQKIFPIICIFTFITIFSGNKLLEAQTKIKTVVIDPGHGGSDPGAVGKISKEKDLVLKISLKFGDYIKKHFKDINVIYTRSDDRHVELYKRSEIANKNNADLFISIHINSFKNNTPYGTETFVMGTSKNAANLQVAKLENSAILKEDNYQDNYDGFDPNDPENHIIFSLYQNANLTQSLVFAQLVQENFTKKLKRFNRGVKQEGFLVLWKTTMPSVLVELGFISNLEEEKYMNSAEGQDNLAKALFEAFVAYKSQYEEQSYDIKVEYNKDDVNNPEILEAKIEMPGINNTEEKTKPSYDENQIVYKIQIKTSPQKIEIIPENFKSYQNVDVYLHNNVYKYTIGEETEYDKIMDLFNQVKKDYKDCFIIKFKNGERI